MILSLDKESINQSYIMTCDDSTLAKVQVVH